MSAAELPPAVEFEMLLADSMHFMERLHDIRQQTGLEFPEELLDKIELPGRIRLSCSLDTHTGQVAILGVDTR